MATARSEKTAPTAAFAWKLGVRARLLLAFLAISAFALLAAAVGIHAFRQVGERLEVIDSRVAPTLISLELSRSAERIIAAAPALLAATDRTQRDQLRAVIDGEAARLKSKMTELERERTGDPALGRLEPIVALLSTNLGALEDVVVRRVNTHERIKSLLRDVFQTGEETGRLLAPWLMILDGQVGQLVESVGRAEPGRDAGEAARQLAASLAQRRAVDAVRIQFAAVADMLAEASGSEREQRLSVLAFQIGRELRELERAASGLDPKLQPLLLAQVGKMRRFSEGPSGIPQERARELGLIGEGQKLLVENARLSTSLADAVDRVAIGARRDIAEATSDALSVQRLSTRALIAAVALSVATSALIVWLYVGRNIVRRLAGLSDGMLAIAGGKLDTPVPVRGADEITAMGHAVEVFRRNAIELEQLLEERQQSAAQLERIVEERTRELERRNTVLRVTFDNMGHGVVMFDQAHRMVAWNQRFQELLGLSDQRVGHDVSFEAFIRHLAERGEYGPCDVDAEVARRLSSTDRPFVGERTRPDGTVLDIRRNPVPSGGFVTIYADVTEQRRAQALIEQARLRLTDAIESLSDGFALWDRDDRLVIFNSRCEALLNAPELFVIGTRFEDLISSFSRSGRYDQSQGGTSGSWVDERIALHRDAPSSCELHLASGFWLHVREFRTQEGGTVTIWTDITTVKQRELDLERAVDKAAEANRITETAYRDLKAAQASLVHAEKMASLGQVTAGIAHEIKNPLNFVNNFADLSAELLAELKQVVESTSVGLKAEVLADIEDLTTTLSGNLSKIVEHGRRADGIVQSMLMHSRGDSGQVQSSNLNALLEDAVNLAYHGSRAQNQNFNVAIRRDLDKSLTPMDLVPQEMSRVFLNLIANALYAMTQRAARMGSDAGYEPLLRVSTRDLGRQVEVRIRDNGDGMTPEVREKLFTPFFTTKPTGEGTGLGLSLSYDIVVKRHAGSIEVESEPGQFTEFRIVLPHAVAASRVHEGRAQTF